MPTVHSYTVNRESGENEEETEKGRRYEKETETENGMHLVRMSKYTSKIMHNQDHGEGVE